MRRFIPIFSFRDIKQDRRPLDLHHFFCSRLLLAIALYNSGILVAPSFYDF